MTGVDDNTLIYRMAFAAVRGMGIELAHRMLDVIPDEKAFFDLGERELQKLTGARNKILERGYRNSLLDKAQRELDFVRRNNIKLLYFSDAEFPQRLLHATDAPILLYSTGKCDLNASHVVSIVGTRRSTPYGSKMCDRLVHDLVEAIPGVIIVSGLAYGTDINAHRAAIMHGTPTVAVQACGLNKIYPSPHRRDAAEIVHRGGLIVSDYMSQDEIHRGNFLARNRIIAALADCTVIIESADHGGSLVTASIAQSYDRDVFAIPGRVGDEYSAGTNRIIMQNNAALITCADDLLRSMRWESEKKPAEAKQLQIFPELSPREQAIVDLLKDSDNSLHINDISQTLQQPMYKLMSSLVDLDMKGVVMTLPGCRYTLK